MSNEPECLPEYSGHRRSDEFRSDGFQIHRGKQPRSGDAIAACRFLDGGEDAGVHLSSWELFQLIPGEILTLEIRKTWNYRKQLHVSGKMLAHGLEISRLDLTPLRLTDQGEWDPHEFFEEELPDYYVPILAAGIRPEFEMEQVVPGDLDPSADGPILEAEEVFERMLWLNPSDNQGVRFLITEVREKRPWKPDL